jgi:hypothetical protein
LGLARTNTLRRQHDAAVALVGDIQRKIGSYRGAADVHAILLSLAKLDGLLRIHFAQEDRSLYPAMISNPDPQVADTAAAYQQEMGELGMAFAKYVARWSGSGSIAGNFPLFRDESASVFAALADRIERENNHLYPLADDMRSAAAA